MATIEERDYFEGFSPPMVLGYIHSEFGDDGLREFMHLLLNPTDAQIIERSTPHMGTVTPYDIRCAREMVYPLDEYAAELREMNLLDAADIVSPQIRTSDCGPLENAQSEV
jgi:hypothetical protein